MSHTTPAQQFGYLSLSSGESIVLVKANTIKTLDKREHESQTKISFSDEHYIVVDQSIDQIIDQLESIHPHMR